MKHQPSEDFQPTVGLYHPIKIDKRTGEIYPGPEVFGASDCDQDYPSKHGQPGDRLWVKETFQSHPIYGHPVYRADWPTCHNPVEDERWPWKPSIFMPRKASRITLEITDVKVERLQDITDNDALAEGIQEDAMAPMSHFICANGSSTREPVYAFETLWESINGHGSWDANPFVWAISFKRIKP